MPQKKEVLKSVFGYEDFRPGQEVLIDALLDGRDVLGIMPTGAGKSICYQLPALMMPGITLVISPLISLMKDQVSALIQNGVRAAFLNSSLTEGQTAKAIANALTGMYKIIYVAPERLFTPRFQHLVQNIDISMVCVDEAHCVSQWGQDFRPGYLQIAQFVDGLPRRPVVGAFTATATDDVRQDIQRLLELREPETVITGFDRPNLYFGVEMPKDKYSAVICFLEAHPGASGIIYCLTRKTVEEVCARLQRDGYDATRYHAGLDPAERQANQDAFLFDQSRIMVATNAFGMGIDKSNVNFVLHYNMPKNLESYYQEAGRAGRDGQPADCLLLYSGRDVATNRFFIEKDSENELLDEETRQIVAEKDEERLRQMTFYCHSNRCLRGFMLHYFGEKAPDHCGNCSICKSHTEEVDVSREARIILLLVQELYKPLGVTILIETLRGSESDRVLRWHLDRTEGYGRLAGCSEARLRRIFDHLIAADYLDQSGGRFPTISMTARGAEHLSYPDEAEPILMLMEKERPRPQTRPIAEDLPPDQKLFEELRALRLQLARRAGLPAFVLFTDASLRAMSAQKPADRQEFLRVPGVSAQKADRYGEAFLKVIARYL